MSSNYDVIVVGVGAMGASACWQLARRGVRMLGLEQFGVGHALGSSHGHTRMIRLAYYEHPDYVPLLRRAYELWDELETASGERVLYRTGGIYMGSAGGEVVGGCIDAARRHGLAQEVLSRDDLARRHPLFDVPADYIGVWEPAAGFLLCEKAIGLFARLAMEAGAEIHGHEPVVNVELRDDRVTVTTPLQTYHADRIVFCGGAWSGKLLADLGVELVVTRQALGWIWPQSPEAFALDAFPVWGIEQPDGSLAYGFPMMSDVPGLKMARHGRGRPVDPDTVSREPTAADREEVLAIARRYLPSAVGPTLSSRICLYTNSPDGHFIVDRHPAGGRAVIACGFSGHGFKFASVMGEILADLATSGVTPLPVGFLGLARFGKSVS
ncbi:MAG: Sarcosine oxidase [Phycisphaerales bacterium]|nr:Sarcosine oxidase [Phycisphaerales bacterium]